MVLKHILNKPFLLLTLITLLIAASASSYTVAQENEESGDSAAESTETVPAEDSDSQPTEPPTEAATEAPTEVPTEIPVQPPDRPTEEPDRPVDMPTEAATEPPARSSDLPTEIQLTEIAPREGRDESPISPSERQPEQSVEVPLNEVAPSLALPNSELPSQASAQSLPFHESFGDDSGWSGSGAWAYTQDSSGVGLWFADTASRTADSALEYQTPISISGVDNAQLVLRQRGPLSSADVVTVEVKPDGGSWSVVDQRSGETLTGDWSAWYVDLSGYRGQTVRLRLHVICGGNVPGGETSVGYWVDELTIQESTNLPEPAREVSPVEESEIEPIVTAIPTVEPSEIIGLPEETVADLVTQAGADADVPVGVADPLALADPMMGTLASPSGTGLQGQYYDSANLSQSRLTRLDSSVNFNWGANAPSGSLGVNTFSVRWTGRVVPRYSQTYTFYVDSDDGVRLWVGGTQIINDWTSRNAERRGRIALNAGQRYSIRLEYYENTGSANARLLWSSSSQSKQVIPSNRLYPPSSVGTFQRPFNSNSIWNRPIPANVTVHPNSANMIALLAQQTNGAFNIDGIQGAWSVPVYRSTSSDPLRTVCDSTGYRPCVSVRIPSNFAPSPDADSKAVVIETFRNPQRAWAFYGMQPAGNGNWTALNGAYGWGDISSNGDGLSNYDGGQWGGRVAGWNYYAGLITPEEIQAGVINHALNMNVPASAGCHCAVWPGIYGDGTSGSPHAIPIGSWIQLDPSINVESLNLSRGGKIIARALQQYGAWVGDTGGMANFSAQEFVRINSSGQAYVDASPWQGLLSYNDTYYFPVNSLRVILPNAADYYLE